MCSSRLGEAGASRREWGSALLWRCPAPAPAPAEAAPLPTATLCHSPSGISLQRLFLGSPWVVGGSLLTELEAVKSCRECPEEGVQKAREATACPVFLFGFGFSKTALQKVLVSV